MAEVGTYQPDPGQIALEPHHFEDALAGLPVPDTVTAVDLEYAGALIENEMADGIAGMQAVTGTDVEALALFIAVQRVMLQKAERLAEIIASRFH